MCSYSMTGNNGLWSIKNLLADRKWVTENDCKIEYTTFINRICYRPDNVFFEALNYMDQKMKKMLILI